VSGYLIDALNEIRLKADAADELAAELEQRNVPRGPLRDLLGREFRLDVADPGTALWLETVIEEIAAIVLTPLADAAASIALELHLLVDDDEDDEGARRRLLCLDCGVNTALVGEYYMLERRVWLEASPDDDGMLCIGCAEKRLGRRLQPDDFMRIALNHSDHASPRLRSRVLGVEEVAAA
jgi:hypothetical protein